MEHVVSKKGQTTIPVQLRKKYKIQEDTHLAVLDTEEGILLKPKKSIWDMIGAYAEYASVEELNQQLDKLRHEDE